MTKMAAMPIYNKKNSSVPYDIETLHTAIETLALLILYKRLSWVDLDLFYNKVNFVHLGFNI